MLKFNSIVSAIIVTNILWVAGGQHIWNFVRTQLHIRPLDIHAVAHLTSLRRLAAAQASGAAAIEPEPVPAGKNQPGFVPQHFVMRGGDLPAPPAPRPTGVVVVTALHKQPCSRTLVGNYLEVLSLKNKENYARLRGYDLQWFTNDVEAGYGGSWNKIRAVLNVMERTPPEAAEWLLWVDSDAQFLNPSVDIPFDRYAGKDVIIWGGNDAALDGDPRGFNAGIMLFRNTNFTRRFLGAVAEYGSERFISGRTFEKVLRRDLGDDYTKGLKDQIAIAHLLKQNPDMRRKVVAADHYLHRMWHWDWNLQDLELEPAPLLVHWPGCGFCKPVDGGLDQRQCVQSFLEVYGMADRTFTAALGTGHPFDMASIEAILQKVW